MHTKMKDSPLKNRSQLVRMCLDKGFSTNQITEMVVNPLKDLPEEQKEAMAQRLIAEVEKM